MDISGDSEDTIILSSDEPSDSEIEDILKRYTSPIASTSKCLNSPNDNEYFNEELYLQSKHVKNDDKYYDNSTFKSLDTETDAKLSHGDVIDLELNDKSEDKLKPRGINKRRQQEIENNRKEKLLQKTRKLQEAELRKVAKNREKERKKEMLEKQKMVKNALKSVAKSTEPDECMKYIIVELDSDLSKNEYGVVLKEAFQKKDISFRTKSQFLPNLISWSRKMQKIDNMVLKEYEVNEKHFLVVMHATEFIKNVNKDTLIINIQNICSLTKCVQLTVAVVGMEKSKPAQQTALIEAEMLTKSYFRFVKNVEGLADLLLEVTKAVAQIPHKLQKEEKYKHLNEYFNDSNKDTVRVDKDGNGLGRLWHQMLTMFPLARLETAEAITAVYPTPAALFQAYETCEKKEELLQDLTVRRAQGPLTSSRRIGPELSRKCFNFFCATENKFL